MTSDPTIDLLKARARLKQHSLIAALENLRCKFGSMFDYRPVGVVDDRTLRQNNPDHPMAEPQRFIRQEAADFINDMVVKQPCLIDVRVLQQLHEALFDRDAAVRMAIAQSLGKLRRPKSIPVLERILEAEDESRWVRDAATVSLQNCRDAEFGE